ncbi:hypothetical protein HN415_00290 [Candidatus Woesearchaeota archaeon]|jgi:hypothetical protein|nr:hypothetical protein [Candidatus Woesearchaeota archaeon]
MTNKKKEIYSNEPISKELDLFEKIKKNLFQRHFLLIMIFIFFPLFLRFETSIIIYFSIIIIVIKTTFYSLIIHLVISFQEFNISKNYKKTFLFIIPIVLI